MSNVCSVIRGTVAELVRHPTRLKMLYDRDSLKMLYDLIRTRDYTEANRRRMNRRVRTAPRAAIGGGHDSDTDMGRPQFEFLFTQGLDPDDALLDIGCGTLRGGEYYIDYLDSGNYTGIDISEEAIERGPDTLPADVRRTNEFDLYVNDDLRFERFASDQFDVAIAQSVFTHTPEETVREALTHIPRVLSDGGTLYATVYLGDDAVRGPSSFEFSADTLDQLTTDAGLELTLFAESDYPHPNGQRMVAFTEVNADE